MTTEKPPYLLFSDVHFHNWKSFSSINANGINSRLQIQLDELGRAYSELRSVGGNLAVCAGDLFHVRGKLAPSVTNPVKEFFEAQGDLGTETVILSGNHDLESNDADPLTSAVSVIASEKTAAINSVTIVRESPTIIMVPWHSDIGELRKGIKMLSDENVEGADLIIHAPLNGVLINIPNVGLNASEFEGMNFKRVFAGHYHNHKRLSDNVWSVGATTHQTWNDVNTQAGFCLVYDEEVKFIATKAPRFVPIGVGADEDECMEVEGNFVRADIIDPTPETMARLRDHMKITHGAASVSIRTMVGEKKSTRADGETVSSVDNLKTSIHKFAEKHHNKAVSEECGSILEEATSE